MTSEKFQYSSKMHEKTNLEIEDGVNFAGKSAIFSLDLVDSQKREYCDKIRELFIARDRNEEAFVKESKAINVVELRAAVRFRTERLTLERLIELYFNALNKKGVIEAARKALIAEIIKHPGLAKIKMNEQTRGHLLAGGSELLHFDFLVGLMEKLGIDHNSLAIDSR